MSFSSLRACIAGFANNAHGNVAMLVGLLMFPMAGVGGLAIDHMQASTAKTRFDTAADAAALAAVNTAKSVAVGSVTWGSGDPIAAGKAAALRVFQANAKNAGNAIMPTPTVTLTVASGVYDATVTWSTTSPTTFGALFGVKTNTIAGKSQAQSGAVTYSDFYIVMDFSASMLVGATDAEVRKTFQLVSCSYACHIRENTLPQVRAAGVRMRVDVMKDAVIAAIQELQKNSLVAKQYRFGIYGFSSEMRTFLDVSDSKSSDFAAVIAAVQAADVWAANGGGTYMPTVMNWMRPKFKTAGDGSSSKPYQRMILVTDGIQNERYNDPNDGKRNLTVVGPWSEETIGRVSNIDPKLCHPIKALGVEIAVAAVHYVNPVAIGVMDWYVPLRTEFNFIDQVLMPNIPSTLGTCASNPALFVHANTPDEIVKAVSNAFSTRRLPTITN